MLLAPPEATVVEVDNQVLPDMNVYVYDGGHRVRLGMAPGSSWSSCLDRRLIVRVDTVLPRR